MALHEPVYFVTKKLLLCLYVCHSLIVFKDAKCDTLYVTDIQTWPQPSKYLEKCRIALDNNLWRCCKKTRAFYLINYGCDYHLRIEYWQNVHKNKFSNSVKISVWHMLRLRVCYLFDIGQWSRYEKNVIDARSVFKNKMILSIACIQWTLALNCKTRKISMYYFSVHILQHSFFNVSTLRAHYTLMMRGRVKKKVVLKR